MKPVSRRSFNLGIGAAIFVSFSEKLFETKQDGEANHEISIVGYGMSEDKVPYWIGRNSWGTYWGEEGWFRIRMHQNNARVEEDCDWAVPQKEKSIRMPNVEFR